MSGVPCNRRTRARNHLLAISIDSPNRLQSSLKGRRTITRPSMPQTLNFLIEYMKIDEKNTNYSIDQILPTLATFSVVKVN